MLPTPPSRPAWLDDARRYRSLIGDARTQPVEVVGIEWGRDAGLTGPTLLRLEGESRRSPMVRVLDAEGREVANIRPEGPVPGLRYAMRRGGGLGWSLTARSIVRRRYTLEPSGGERWSIETPFFWWSHPRGVASGVPRLLGAVGPGMWAWELWVEPGWDSFDLLTAFAFLHRQWSHW